MIKPIEGEGKVIWQKLSMIPVFIFCQEFPASSVLKTFPLTPTTRAMSGEIQKTLLF